MTKPINGITNVIEFKKSINKKSGDETIEMSYSLFEQKSKWIILGNNDNKVKKSYEENINFLLSNLLEKETRIEFDLSENNDIFGNNINENYKKILKEFIEQINRDLSEIYESFMKEKIKIDFIKINE